MPERVELDALRAAAPLRVGAVTLLPIAHVVMRGGLLGRGGWAVALVRPRALVVRDAAGVRVVDVGAGVVSLDLLREAIPGLDALLDSP